MNYGYMEAVVGIRSYQMERRMLEELDDQIAVMKEELRTLLKAVREIRKEAPVKTGERYRAALDAIGKEAAKAITDGGKGFVD